MLLLVSFFAVFCSVFSTPHLSLVSVLVEALGQFCPELQETGKWVRLRSLNPQQGLPREDE